MFNLTEEQSEKIGDMMSYVVLAIGLYLAYSNQYPSQVFLIAIALIAMALHEILD